ncbi:MAG: hypothetical protein ACRD3T_08065 [Terriglobia bacterium]
MNIEGTIQFIINQQAQFVADIHSFQEGLRGLQENVRLVQESHRQLETQVGKLTTSTDKLYEIVSHHEDAHVVTSGMISKLASALIDYVDRQGWLFDAHQRAEAKLDKFIDKMDGFIDEMRRNFQGRNGRSDRP